MAQERSLDKRAFGELWKYIRDDKVTNIDWDNGQLWIQEAGKVRRLVEDHSVTDKSMVDLSIRVGNLSGSNFNKTENIIYADVQNLRITCIHDSLSSSGVTVNIRKSLNKLRFNTKMAVDSGYADEEVIHLLINCVLAGMSFTFCGKPGRGKTESAKFFSSYIPFNQKVVTVEDVREWHYKDINPGKSCVEMKVDAENDYEKILSASLRINPEWLMMGEARGREARYLLEAWSNGVSSMCTLHTKGVREIPNRMLNMLGSDVDIKAVTEQVYESAGVGIYLDTEDNGDGTLKFVLSELGFFYREQDTNRLSMVVEDGVLYKERLPKHIAKYIKKCAHTEDAFYCSIAHNNTAPLVSDIVEEDEDEVVEVVEPLDIDTEVEI